MRFGTDGVRGRAFSEISVELARSLARAVGAALGTQHAVIGGDSRESTPQLLNAVADGLSSVGIDVVNLGVVPTPVVAAEAADRGSIGVVVSASHNPYHDNGIKVFGPGGVKLADAQEREIEALWNDHTESHAVVGHVHIEPTDVVVHRHIQRIHAALEGRSLDGVHIVIDAANGAASGFAGDAFAALGAQVTLIHADPNGRNINERCGATDTASLSETVRAVAANLGLALDGDADRLIAVDDQGNVVNGDRILALLAQDLKTRGRLNNDVVVTTVMANLGFRLAMRAAGITVIETPVGDRYVLEALSSGGYSIGGEQSGHIIVPEFATTGDGLLTGALLVDIVRRQGRPLSVMSDAVMTELPQVLINVEVAPGRAVVDNHLRDSIDVLQKRLGDRGRILVRPSGTEPFIRVMVEAPSVEEAHEVATAVAELVAAEMAAPEPNRVEE